MSYVKIWLHCVWGTKKRIPFLTKSLLSELTAHIKTNATEKGIYIDTINGYKEHIHCIISLSSEQCLSKVMQMIKGESSFWINRNRHTKFRFEWAVDYYGVSFGESELGRVRSYIRNQERHHSGKTWEDECEDMIIRYGFDKFRDNAIHS